MWTAAIPCLLLAFLSRTISGDLLPNVAFPGNDVERISVPDPEYCQLACTFHPLCTAFTFLSKNNTHDPRFTCYLKTNVTNKSSSPISTSGFTLAKNATNLRRCYPKTFTDVNFLGNDYLTLAEDNMASCQDACARSPYCQFFSYNKSTNGPQCFLKFNFTIVSPSAIHLQLGVESGFSQRDCCTGDGCHQGCAGVLIPDMNLEGTLITEFQASDVVKCQLACTENPHCHFFTFYTNNWSVNNFRRACSLRSSQSGIPTGMTHLDHVLSGFTKKSTEFQKSDLECADFLLPNVDFQGSVIGSILARDARHCQRMCTQHPQCQFFTFITERWSQDNRKLACLLKSSDAKIPQKVYPLSDVVSGYSLMTSGVQKSTTECANLLFNNMDFCGDDIGSTIETNATVCQLLCTNHSQCQYFTLLKSSNLCLLKGNKTGIPLHPRQYSNCSSGFSLGISGIQKGPKGCADLVLSGWELLGTDIESHLAVDADHCQLLCSHHPRCQIFTFFPKEWNTATMRFHCILKQRNSSLVTNLIRKNTTVSGFSTMSPGYEKRCIRQSYRDVELAGIYQRAFPASTYESCQELCTADPSCPFFSYNTDAFPTESMRGLCYLKYANDLPMPFQVHDLPGTTSGFPVRNCEGDLPGYAPPIALDVSLC